MLVTPYDLQDKSIGDVTDSKKVTQFDVSTFQYKNKLKAAIITFLLFIVLSHKVAFKILQLIIQVFSNNVTIIDENENPLFMGTILMAGIAAIIIFVFS